MERRTFVKRAFGLVALATCAGAGLLYTQGSDASGSAGTDASAALGPVLREGIELRDEEDGTRVAGVYGGTKLFVVDPAGALLATLADGTRTIEEAADEAGVSAADAASFYVEMGQAGYLENEVYVNLGEVWA